jgi:hypothetical protein
MPASGGYLRMVASCGGTIRRRGRRRAAAKPIYYGKKGSADIIGLTVTVHQRSGMKIG